MNQNSDLPEATAEELLRLMQQADGGQPFMTHRAAAAMGAYILAELGKMAARAAEPSAKHDAHANIGPRLLLTKKELAKALNAGTTTIDNMRKLPGFPEHHLTGTTRGLRFDLAEVQAWQEKQRQVKEAMAL